MAESSAAQRLAEPPPEPVPPSLPSLPLALQALVLQLLPVDEVLLLNRVSPAWMVMVAEPGLWTHVSLSRRRRRSSDRLLRAVGARAAGSLRALDVSGLLFFPNSLSPEVDPQPPLSVDALEAVCAACAPTLRLLDARCAGGDGDGDQWACLAQGAVARLLAAAPRLDRLDADVRCATSEQALAALRSPALRVRRLGLEGGACSGAVAAALADPATQPSVCELSVSHARLDSDAAMSAVVGFAMSRRLRALALEHDALNWVALPHLARLLAAPGSALVALEVLSGPPPSPALVAALAAGRLQRLRLAMVNLWVGEHLSTGIALLAAATGHPTLRHLDVSYNNVLGDAPRAAVGAVLGALAAADSLSSLAVAYSSLGDEGLRPLVDALPGSARLAHLRCEGNTVTRFPFAAALLAAAGANTSLRVLRADAPGSRLPELGEAEDLVAARERGRSA